MSKNYSAKLTSKTTKKIATCLAWFAILYLRWNDTLKIAMALLHRHLHQMSIPAPGVDSSHPSQVLHPTIGHPNFRRMGIGSWIFSWRPHFFDDGGCFLCEKKCVVDIWCKSCVFNHINIYVCVSQFDDPKDEIQGKSLSSRRMNCWDVNEEVLKMWPPFHTQYVHIWYQMDKHWPYDIPTQIETCRIYRQAI